MLIWPLLATLVALLALAALIDLRERRIPNWLTFGAAAAGLAFQVWTSGPSGFLVGAGGWLTATRVVVHGTDRGRCRGDSGSRNATRPDAG